MKIKNVLCVAALSAAVALSGAPAGGVAEVVQAEENQFANLDEILRAMYAYYENGDYASMHTLVESDMITYYTELIRNSGSDRYVLDFDGGTKAALLYISETDGWRWYFGQMENNLRQGNGTTIILYSGTGETQAFTGSYTADFPSGESKWSILHNNGTVFNISGNFQGTSLNGTYQVDVNWIYDGISYASNLPITYVNNHMQSVGGWNLDLYPYEEYGYTEYNFWNDDGYLYFEVNSEYEMLAVGLSTDGWRGKYLSMDNEQLNTGLPIFMGNTAASAFAPVDTPTPEVTIPVPTVPENQVTVPTPEVTTPTPTVSSGTYIVERGDNLSRIAQKVYGDRKLWRKIYEANSNVIKSDYMIWANQVLIIPEL